MVACDAARKFLVLFNPKVTTLAGALPRTEPAGTPEARGITPGDPPFDCALGEKDTVRLKLGAGAAMPYGRCGADPPLFASIWINQVKVLSAKDYSGQCMQEKTPLSHLRVTPTGVSWCTAPVARGGAGDPERVKCVETHLAPLPKSKDLAEFPPGGTRRDPPGAILVDHAIDDALCGAMARRNRHHAGARAFPLPPPSGSEVELLALVPLDEGLGGIVYRGRFDLDNDGAPDDVLMHRSLSGAEDADELLGAPDHAFTGDQLDEAALERLRGRSHIRIPTSWATGESRYDGPYYDIKNLRAELRSSPARTGSTLLRSTRLRLRYIHLEPFRHRGTTYLLSSPPEWALDLGDTFVLFRPRPKGPPDEVCVFHQVQENF